MKISFTRLKFLQKKKFLYPLAGLFAIIILAVILSPKASSVPTTDVKEGDFDVTITASGEIRATKSVTISSPGVWYNSNFQIVWELPEGTTVKEGDVVIQLDTTNIVKTIADQQSQLDIHLSELAKMNADHKATEHQMEADLKNAEFQYELSKLSYERVRFEAETQKKEKELQLKRDSIAVEQAKRRVVTQEEISKSELMKVNAEVEKARSDVEKARRDIKTFTLRAPMGGLVVYETHWNTGKKMAVSDQVWPGSTLATLPDLSHMQSVGSVNEVDVSKVKKGQKVKVKLDAFPEKEFHGTISSVGTIGQQADRNSSIKTFEIVVDIDEADLVLKPGMTTSNEILVQTVPKSVFVPLESVFNKNGKTVVYKMSHSSPDELVVETGVRNSNYVIIAKGLKAGDKVTLRDPTVKDETPAVETETKETKL